MYVCIYMMMKKNIILNLYLNVMARTQYLRFDGAQQALSGELLDDILLHVEDATGGLLFQDLL